MLRPFTFPEFCRLALLADTIGRETDAELGAALTRVARGDDDALAIVHDRLNVLGEFAHADRVRRLLAG